MGPSKSPLFLPFAGVLLALASGCGGGTQVDNACFGVKEGELVITEVMPDPDGADTGREYFEIYNASGRTIPSAGLTLIASKGDGTSEKWHVIAAAQPDAPGGPPPLPAGGYLAVGDIRDGEKPEYILYSYADTLGALPNDNGRLAIRCGDTLVDEFRWEAAPTSGRALIVGGTAPLDASANDAAENRCESPLELSPGSKLYGSPGAPNSSCEPAVTCQDMNDSGIARPIVSPEPGEVFITEVMANPSGTDSEGEWLELHATADVDLNGLTLSVNDDKSSVLQAPECLRLAAGAYVVLARSEGAVSKAQLPEVIGFYKFDLPNSTATLRLKKGETVVDVASYGPPKSGVASQLNPALLNGLANDVQSGFCPAPLSWEAPRAVTDKGSPGEKNPSCDEAAPPPPPPPPPPTEGECTDVGTGQKRAIRRPAVGQLLFSEVMADPSFTEPASEWFELYASAEVDLNGVRIRLNDGTPMTFTSAECLTVKAQSYVLLARSSDPDVNGGLPPPHPSRLTFSLPNTGTQRLVAEVGDVELDAFTYSTEAKRAPANASLQVSSSKLNERDNDLPENLCSPAATYGPDSVLIEIDRGTPGKPNEDCPPSAP